MHLHTFFSNCIAIWTIYQVARTWRVQRLMACFSAQNSAYRCLWPGCDKVLNTIVKIRRHIRNTHLSR